MVRRPWIFLKPHVIKKFSTLQRLIVNSKVHCLAIQSKGHKCEAKIAKLSYYTSTLVFHDQFKLAVNKEAILKIMWFSLMIRINVC